MGSTKHEKSFVDFEMPYEQNIIGFKGIIYFAVGLLILIVITFGLMWALEGVLEDSFKESKASTNPMRMSDKERLPPEPRLQLAPGFQVQTEDTRVNLELLAPQAEYRVLQKHWMDVWEHGRKDPKTGALVAMPIDQAIEKLIETNPKAKSGPEAEKAAHDANSVLADSSAGRTATLRRR
jgi:hypothetical protein